jgi:hypothetical protein
LRDRNRFERMLMILEIEDFSHVGKGLNKKDIE